MDTGSVKEEKTLVERPIYKSLSAFSWHYEICRIYEKEYAKIALSPEKLAKDLKAKIDEYDKNKKFSFTEDIPISFRNAANNPQLKQQSHAKKHLKKQARYETLLEAQAADKTLDIIDSSCIRGSNSTLTHRHQKIITIFFDALFINPEIFKMNRRYIMTQPLSILFEGILDEADSYTRLIASQQFDKVPIKKAQQIYSRIIAAIDAAPVDLSAGTNTKDQQKTKLRAFFNSQYNCDITLRKDYDNNSVVDVILNAVWYCIMKEHWVPDWTLPSAVDDDWGWQSIVDCVYDELYQGKVLMTNTDDRIRDKAKLRLTIPPMCILKRKCPEMYEMIECTRYNPNIEEDSFTPIFSLPEKLKTLL